MCDCVQQSYAGPASTAQIRAALAPPGRADWLVVRGRRRHDHKLQWPRPSSAQVLVGGRPCISGDKVAKICGEIPSSNLALDTNRHDFPMINMEIQRIQSSERREMGVGEEQQEARNGFCWIRGGYKSFDRCLASLQQRFIYTRCIPLDLSLLYGPSPLHYISYVRPIIAQPLVTVARGQHACGLRA